MHGILRALRRLFERFPRGWAETSRVIVGSTGSGKSEGELADLVRLAARGDCAVVLLDAHGPLAKRAAAHWAGRGHEGRIVYEPLDAVDRVLCWDMLPRSQAPDPLLRRIEDAETRDELAQCFLVHRNLQTLNDRPWTKEWLEAAIALCQGQPGSEPLTSLLDAFRVGSAAYERLLQRCEAPEVVEKFRGLERLRRKNEVQYEAQAGASRRLVELVCASEVVRLRCRPGAFDWLQALRGRRLIAFDGGGIRSREIKRAVFLLATMQVIHAARRHFARTQRPLPVVLVLEEAGALGLVTPFVLAALQELRKAGLAIHLITQSCLDFGDRDLFETVLANTPWQAWYQVLAPADQELGARALANATFDPRAVHFTRERLVHDGARTVATASRGASVDAATGRARSDSRTGTAFLSRHRSVSDEHYKSPQLHEQEYRTALARLRVGERLVRDRRRVVRQRVRRVRRPLFRFRGEAEDAGAVIGRVREAPWYRPCAAEVPAARPPPGPGAAERLRAEGAGEARRDAGPPP